ncbi:MAG TPA: T9SS type A sorting domain-containing protein, partial [Polyangia bacterium]|nr:T9SS type A sorting domain-containing protein [Polyangia bacterium]
AGTQALTATGNGFILYLAGHFFLMQMAALPASGTVWNTRYYTGVITGTAAAADFAFVPDVRPAAVPGLRVRVAFTGSTLDPTTTTAANLERIHTVPDPYYVSNALETTANNKVLQFVNLPAQAVVRIYSLSGVLVNVLTHDDPTGGGILSWNLRNRNNQFVASGVYFYHVEAPDGKTKVGRFTVVNFAP